MKSVVAIISIIISSLFFKSHVFGQSGHSHTESLRKKLPLIPNYTFNKDSLTGFEESHIKKIAQEEGFEGEDIKRLSYLLKRKYIDEKYLIGKYKLPSNSRNYKLGNNNPTTQSIDCTTENYNFENGTGSGWALSGNTQIVSSGTDPYGSFPFVYPGGGSYSLRISDDVSGNGDWGQAVKTIAVPANGVTLFTFHFAMSIFGYPHTASDAAKFKVDFFDASNNPIPCPKYECYHSTDNGDVGVSNFTNTPNSASSYNGSAVGDSPGSNPATTANWNDVTLDLTGYAGQTISARFRIDWCVYGPDWAYCLVDADCPINNFDPIPVCGGPGTSICGPTNMLSYSWTTPSGAVLTTSCITASTAGIYTINVVPTNVQCSAAPTFTYLYGVSENPTIHISSNPVCLNSATNFTNTSTVPTPDVINLWEWDFNNDGVTDNTTLQPSTTYSAIGTYTVGLTATATSGCKATGTIQTTVYDNPSASFIATEVCYNQATNLLSSSNGNGNPITNHAWDFTGDNIADITGPNSLNYTMPLVGNNTVNYTVTTTPVAGLSCKTSTTQLVITDPLPQAAFTFVNNCVNAQPNTFDGSASLISSGTIDNYAWDFGDTQTDNSPLATTTHNYNLPIQYNVSLNVTSDKGCQGSVSHQVEVYPLPLAEIYSKPNVCFGSATTFTAGQLPNSGNVISWQWDVNNTPNTIELTGQQNSYTFANEGWQVLNVIATTDHGCIATITRNVYVNYIPQPQFIVDDPDGCPLPHCVVFTDQTAVIPVPSKVISWDWNFGNGSSSTATTNSNQSTCYTNSSSNQLALYTVTLTAKTDSGCVASLVKPNFITVYPTPIAQYTVVPEFGNVVVPLVHFVNQSVDYTQVNWNFGDGKSDLININPNHDYATLVSTDYFSSLIVTNQYGCTDTAEVPVNIGPDFVFYIPNTFTPNDDGINDWFTGMGVGIVKYEMWIYNRWGSTMYYTDDIYKAWNGKLQGSSNDAKEDVYSWKVELKDVFGKKHNYVGHVTLLR